MTLENQLLLPINLGGVLRLFPNNLESITLEWEIMQNWKSLNTVCWCELTLQQVRPQISQLVLLQLMSTLRTLKKYSSSGSVAIIKPLHPKKRMWQYGLYL